MFYSFTNINKKTFVKSNFDICRRTHYWCSSLRVRGSAVLSTMALCSPTSSPSLHSLPSRFPSPRRLHGGTTLSLPQQPLLPMSSWSLSSKTPSQLPSSTVKLNRSHNHHRNFFKFRASATSSSGSGSGGASVVLLTSTVTVTLAVANRVLYKLALVPMSDYPFFLAQLTTFG